jgi:hypothetical protein
MDKNQPFCVKMFHYYGYQIRSDPTLKRVGHNTKKDVGRADLVITRKGKGIYVECKRADTSFAFSQWTQKQRKWAEIVESPTYGMEYYLYLTIGVDRPNSNIDKFIPKTTWLIPRRDYLDAEALIVKYGVGNMLLKVHKNTKKEVKDEDLTAYRLLAPYQLQWNKAKSLDKPEHFKLWKEYLMIDKDQKPSDTPDMPDIDVIMNDSENVKYGGFWTIPESHIFYKKHLV